MWYVRGFISVTSVLDSAGVVKLCNVMLLRLCDLGASFLKWPTDDFLSLFRCEEANSKYVYKITWF